MSSSQEVGGARRKVRDSSNVTNAIASASDHGSSTVNISNSTFQVGSNITSSAMQFEDEIDWEDEDVKRHINGFINAHNNKTDERTQDKVTATFTNLKTPKKQVNPRFIDADYYRGKTSVKSEEYVPDSLYEGRGRRSIDGKCIELHQTLDGINVINYAAFVADAGAGKTTSAKRFAQMVLKKQIPSLEHIKLVRYVTIATLDADEKSTAYHLLFTNGMGDELSEGMKKYGYYWVKKHSHEILLVLDGLDQANWVLDRNFKKIIAYEKEYLPSVIFYNILHKNVLKKCKIVMTSREHTMLNIPEDIRPQRTITLNGLSEKDQEYLILELAGERGKDILHHLRTNALYVMSLCQTPVFLVFSVAVYEDNSDNLPDTLSEVLIRVLAYFIMSEYRRETSMASGTFEKLKQLAYKGTSERRVLFSCKEIQELGLDPEKVRDLIITTPHKSAKGMFHLMEGRVNLFFCHQLIQEALCALHICDMMMKDFKEFISHHLCKPHYSIVRQILVGVLLNPRMNHIDIEPVLGTVKEEKRKSSMIYDWLKDLASTCHGGFWSSITQLFKPRHRYAELGKPDFELCTLLQECGDSADDIIKQHIPSLEDQNAPMEIDNMFVFISMLSQCNELITDYVTVAPANSSEMKLFADCLIKIQHFEIGCLEVVRRGQNKIGRWQQSSSQHTTEHQSSDKKIKVLNLIGNFNYKPLFDFKLLLSNSALDVLELLPLNYAFELLLPYFALEQRRLKYALELDGNRKLEPDAFRYIGEIIKQCKVEEVMLSSCNLSADKVSKLQEGIDDYSGKIKVLNLDRNDALEPDGFRYIGEIIKQCKVEEVTLWSCNLSADKVSKLQEGIDDYSGKIKGLNLGYNKELEPDGFRYIGEIIKQCKVEEVTLSSCNLSADKVSKLQEGIDDYSGKIKVLNLDRNDDLEPDGFQYIGEIIKQCKVEEVTLRCCKLSADKVSKLQEGIDDYFGKIKVLNLIDNKDLEPDGFRYIGEIIKQCKVEEVKLWMCNLSADKVSKLQEGIDDYSGKVKFQTDFGDFESLERLMRVGNKSKWPQKKWPWE